MGLPKLDGWDGKLRKLCKSGRFWENLQKVAWGYLHQFCSDFKNSDTKNDQKSKGYKIGLVKLVWPRF